MRNLYIKYITFPVCILVLISFTGCLGNSNNKQEQLQSAAPVVQNQPTSTDNKQATDNSDQGTSSTETQPSPSPTAPTETVEKPTENKVVIQEAYNNQKPSLMSIKINDTKDKVITQFGKPKDEFEMEDDQESLLVYEYTGFSVGFNEKNLVQFVDVSSANVDPRLNGFRVGQQSKDALKALGKPDANTSYVISYKGDGVILKLDVDPKTETVNSIKLFKEAK